MHKRFSGCIAPHRHAEAFFSTVAPTTVVAKLTIDRCQLHQHRSTNGSSLHRQIEGVGSEVELATLDVGLRVERAAAEFLSETLERANSANQSPDG